MDHVVREMPPVDDRETRPSDNVPLPLGGPCYDDRLVVPPLMDHREMVPTPAPPPEPEVIPTPAAAMVLPGTRSVLVRAPQSAGPRPPSAAGGVETIWQPLDPSSSFAAADAADVPGFLAGLEQRRPSARIAGQPAPIAVDRRHAESRVALVPMAAPRGMPQPIAGPAVRSPVAARQPATRSPAASLVGLWTPLEPRAFMASAADLPAPYGWATMPPDDPLAVVRRLAGRTSPPQTMARSAAVQQDRVAVPSTAVSRAVPPAPQPPSTGMTEPDWLRLLVLVCVAAALAVAVVGWPRENRAGPERSAARSRVMMRNGGR